MFADIHLEGSETPAADLEHELRQVDADVAVLFIHTDDPHFADKIEHLPMIIAMNGRCRGHYVGPRALPFWVSIDRQLKKFRVEVTVHEE